MSENELALNLIEIIYKDGKPNEAMDRIESLLQFNLLELQELSSKHLSQQEVYSK
jgi:hypothetical protein